MKDLFKPYRLALDFIKQYNYEDKSKKLSKDDISNAFTSGYDIGYKMALKDLEDKLKDYEETIIYS